MSKFLLNDGYVLIGTYDLSNYAYSLDTPSKKEQVDVSGFNSTASKEYLPGPREDTITIGFLQDFTRGTAGPHSVLWTIYSTGATFTFDIRSVSPTTNSTVSTTNPALRGTASLYEYNGLSGQIGNRAEFNAVLKPAPNTFFTYQTS